MDSSDEANCATSVCLNNEYRCRSGQCIQESLRCDSHIDCLDGTDEVGCIQCNANGTLRRSSDGKCECKVHVTGTHCDQCSNQSFNLDSKWRTGCIKCFCSGVTSNCISSSLYRDSIRSSFTAERNDAMLINNFEAPEEVNKDAYYWRLPSYYTGNRIKSYGGYLNYTIQYEPAIGYYLNNAPDVVIRSKNFMTILHYRRDEVAPYTSQPYQVPILEEYWQRVDGNPLKRQYLLMALADILDIFIKATYVSEMVEATLSHVALDTVSMNRTENSAIATEVEQCSCPLGYQGTSCEDCAPGYTRTGDSIYFGLCKPCNCHGHSDECDAKTGVCHVSLK